MAVQQRRSGVQNPFRKPSRMTYGRSSGVGSLPTHFGAGGGYRTAHGGQHSTCARLRNILCFLVIGGIGLYAFLGSSSNGNNNDNIDSSSSTILTPENTALLMKDTTTSGSGSAMRGGGIGRLERMGLRNQQRSTSKDDSHTTTTTATAKKKQATTSHQHTKDDHRKKKPQEDDDTYNVPQNRHSAGSKNGPIDDSDITTTATSRGRHHRDRSNKKDPITKDEEEPELPPLPEITSGDHPDHKNKEGESNDPYHHRDHLLDEAVEHGNKDVVHDLPPQSLSEDQHKDAIDHDQQEEQQQPAVDISHDERHDEAANDNNKDKSADADVAASAADVVAKDDNKSKDNNSNDLGEGKNDIDKDDQHETSKQVDEAVVVVDKDTIAENPPHDHLHQLPPGMEEPPEINNNNNALEGDNNNKKDDDEDSKTGTTTTGGGATAATKRNTTTTSSILKTDLTTAKPETKIMDKPNNTTKEAVSQESKKMEDPYTAKSSLTTNHKTETKVEVIGTKNATKLETKKDDSSSLLLPETKKDQKDGGYDVSPLHGPPNKDDIENDKKDDDNNNKSEEVVVDGGEADKSLLVAGDASVVEDGQEEMDKKKFPLHGPANKGEKYPWVEEADENFQPLHKNNNNGGSGGESVQEDITTINSHKNKVEEWKEAEMENFEPINNKEVDDNDSGEDGESKADVVDAKLVVAGKEDATHEHEQIDLDAMEDKNADAAKAGNKDGDDLTEPAKDLVKSTKEDASEPKASPVSEPKVSFANNELKVSLADLLEEKTQ